MTQEEILARAYKAYPENIVYSREVCNYVDMNSSERDAYIKALTELNTEYIRKDVLFDKLDRAKKLRIKGGESEASSAIQVIDALIKFIENDT